MIDIKKPEQVSTAATTAVGLIGGWLTARETGIRPLGGVVLAAAGAWSVRSWINKTNPLTTSLLATGYCMAFGASHPLAKKIGAWPSVLAVTAAVSGAAYAFSDSK